MKINLLLVTSLLTGAAFAQFTQTNQPTIGNSVTMYVADSNATDFANVTGTGVTWDYSPLATYAPVATKTVSAIAGVAPFGSATFGIEIPNFITSFYSANTTSRNCIGFIFQEPSLGAIEVDLSANNETVMNYPFAVSNTLTDAFSGEASVSISPLPIPLTGNVSALVDGSGSLIVAGTTFNNVLRYKIIESATANAGPLGAIQMDRIQYEYYDLATSPLPLFVHSKLTLTSSGTATTQNLVLSSVLPTGNLAISESNATEFSMFPNPAKETVSFSGLSGTETIQLVDLTGKVVLSTSAVNSNSIDISAIKSGIYNVVVIKNGTKSVKKLTIQ